ncbi:MAG: DUF2085 domain-containing protein [Chloroflexi bacterium]|nr:DUF2085 domain-containing protein [Chloroflexota bacterium]
MSSFIREARQSPDSKHRRLSIVAVIPAVTFVAFLLAPGSVAQKTHLALHGLCAQRPSHSLQIGGATLPMDARMTGIYIGAAVAVGWLVAAHRLRAVRIPSFPVMFTLAVFVVALAVDGFNALLVDLGTHHPYEPSNKLRLVTGILGGTALGTMTGHLFAASVWARVDRLRSVVASPAELFVPVGISLAIGTLAMADLPILYAPFAFGLLLAAVALFSLLGTIVAALVSDRGWAQGAIEDLVPLLVAGFAAALVVIAALSWLRFAAEQFFGLPRLT